MKKRMYIVIGVIAVLACIWIAASSFMKRDTTRTANISRPRPSMTKAREVNGDIFSSILKDNQTTYVVKRGDTLGRIAKSFDTTVGLIMKTNNLKSDLIRPGQRLLISTARYTVEVDVITNILTLKSNNIPLKTYTIATGISSSTPLGAFKIINKLKDPVWYKTGAVVPSGSPENILGTRWMGLSVAGYGIHGTTKPESIGQSVTAGCVRMLIKDVEELYDILPIGTDVIIKNKRNI